MAWLNERSRDGGIDEIPLADGVRGRLFLCGKHAIGPDPEALLARVGATAVVCLNEVDELDDRYPNFVAWLRANGPDRAVHHPIPDFHAPSLDDLDVLVETLHDRLRAGEVMVVNCGGGIGRAGTLAVAILLRHGVPMDDAIAIVRSNRPMAGPEVGVQADVLRALEQRYRERSVGQQGD